MVGNMPLTLNGNGMGTGGQDAAFFAANPGGQSWYGGLITLGSSSTISADIGAFVISNPGAIVGSGFTLTLGGIGAGSLASSIATGSGGLIEDSGLNGYWQVGGNNTYTGSTIVNSGTLYLSGTNTSSAVIVNSGALQLILDNNPSGLFTALPTLTMSGGTLGVSNASATSATQTLGNLNLMADTDSSIAITAFGGAGTTLTLGSTFTRGADSILNLDLSAGGSKVVSTSGVRRAAARRLETTISLATFWSRTRLARDWACSMAATKSCASTARPAPPC